MFRIKACSEFMPPPYRLPFRPYPDHVETHPGNTLVPPVLTAFIHIDTSSVVHLHSSLQNVPDRFFLPFPYRSRHALLMHAA